MENYTIKDNKIISLSIPTNKEVATQMENFARSPVLSRHRSFVIGEIECCKPVLPGEDYYIMNIHAKNSDIGIAATDIFWLGMNTARENKDKIIERPRALPIPA